MISSLQEVFAVARRSKPVKIAIIAPEDQEFMRAAEKAGLDYCPSDIVEINDRQGVANRALEMLYQGDVRMVSKGQIPTAYIYRSIIRKKKEAGEGAADSIYRELVFGVGLVALQQRYAHE